MTRDNEQLGLALAWHFQHRHYAHGIWRRLSCARGWQACFLVYLIGIIPLVLVIFMLKEPPKMSSRNKKLLLRKEQEVDTHIPGIVWPYVILLTVAVTVAMPTILFSSMIMMKPFNADSGSHRSSPDTAMTVVGMLSGFTLNPVYKKARKWTLQLLHYGWASFSRLCSGCSCCRRGNMVAYIACFLIGHWGFAIIIPGTSAMLTNLVPIGAATKTIGIFTCFHQMGCFLATPVATFLG